MRSGGSGRGGSSGGRARRTCRRSPASPGRAGSRSRAPRPPVRKNECMPTLVLLRHGQSEWNLENLFTGWVDVDLSDTGVKEAKQGGVLLREQNVLPDVLHTSLLIRAIRTATLALEECGRSWIPVRRSWRLNERHYGALQGLDKSATKDKYGDEQFMLWRRSYDTPPP